MHSIKRENNMKNFEGRKHSEETKKKMSLAQKGKKMSEKTKKKISLAMKGQVRTAKQNRNISNRIFEGKSMAEWGRELGVTREMIRQRMNRWGTVHADQIATIKAEAKEAKKAKIEAVKELARQRNARWEAKAEERAEVKRKEDRLEILLMETKRLEARLERLKWEAEKAELIKESFNRDPELNVCKPFKRFRFERPDMLMFEGQTVKELAIEQGVYRQTIRERLHKWGHPYPKHSVLAQKYKHLTK
jgi:Zn-dependent peptidase ImmA (M78 family)